MDNKAAMLAHVSNLCRLASYVLYKIGHNLHQPSTEKLVHADVLSRLLDYCNSLIYGLPALEIRKVQLIQDSAARLITRTKKHEKITPVLKIYISSPYNNVLNFNSFVLFLKFYMGWHQPILNEIFFWCCSGRALRSTAPTFFNLLIIVSFTVTEHFLYLPQGFACFTFSYSFFSTLLISLNHILNRTSL